MARTARFLILLCSLAHSGFSATKSDSTTQQSGAMMMAMPMVAPLFIEGQDFTSTLLIVNAASIIEYADVNVRGSDGTVVASRRVNIGPHNQESVEIRKLLDTTHSGVSTGSILVSPNPESGSAVAAALSITHRTGGKWNYIDEELAMPSTEGSDVLRAVADSGDGPIVGSITSLIPSAQQVTISCLPKNGEMFSKTIELGAEETLVTEMCEKSAVGGGGFVNLWDKSEGSSESRGVALRSDSTPGSFAAFAVVPHRQGESRFLSSVAFNDPKMVMSSTDVFVGVPVGRSAFLATGSYTPQLTVANFGANRVQATIEYAETSGDDTHVRDLMMLSVPPLSTREVQLDGLDGNPAMKNSFLVQSNAAAGDLVAKLVGKGGEQLPEVELLAKDAMDPQHGGNHPWSLQKGNDSVLLLFNYGHATQSFSVAIATENAVWSKTYHLKPMETKAISVGTIVAKRVKDDKQNVLPKDALSGEINWVTFGDGYGKGRLLEASRTLGLARNYSCGYFPEPCQPATLDIIPSTIPVSGSASGDFQFTVCAAPDQFSCTGPTTSGSGYNVNWTSEDTSIADAYDGEVDGEGAGTTEIIATATGEFGNCSAGAGADVTVSACPTTVAVSTITQESLSRVFPAEKTGLGITAAMQVGPSGNSWNGDQLTESLTTTSNSCPGSWGNLCAGSDTFTVGQGPVETVDGQILPAEENIFYDEHVIESNVSLLNSSGISSCQAVCHQTYSCNGHTVGSVTVTYSFSKSTISGTPVTIVSATDH